MRINHNIAALNTYRQLNTASTAQSKSMEKLSSGLRINRAGDDAAGLAISEKMRSQVRGLDQASKNSQDGISLIQTAEGALNETHDILQRMRELATQAGNDTNTTADRKEIQKEMNQLTSEINRIGNTTEFNTQKLLNGGSGSPLSNVNADAAFTSAAVTASSGLTGANHTIAVTYNAGSAGTNISSTSMTHSNGSGTATANISGTYSGSGDLSTITVARSGSTWTVNGDSVTPSTNDLTWNGLTISLSDISNTADGDQFTYSGTINAPVAAGYSATIDGSAVTSGSVASGAGSQTFTTADGKSVTADLGTFNFTTAGAKNITFDQSAAGSGYSASLQIGANQGQNFSVEIRDMRSTALGVAGTAGAGAAGVNASDAVTGASFAAIADTDALTDNSGSTEYALDVTSATKASAAIKVIDQAIESVSSERSKLGAYQNRLEHTINNLNTSSENLTAAESRIRDVDMAKEMMTQTKNSILSQAAQAMLAQANQQPQGVLQLLR